MVVVRLPESTAGAAGRICCWYQVPQSGSENLLERARRNNREKIHRNALDSKRMHNPTAPQTYGSPAAPLTSSDGLALRALVVDDELDIAEVVAGTLHRDGWQVRTAGSGAEALRACQDFVPDVVVLDVMLPDMNGVEVLRRLREQRPELCVVFLTARDAVSDRVSGITAGADDYITKPFSLDELAARVRGLARRAGRLDGSVRPVISVGSLTMDEDAREVRRDGDLIELTPTEFELLRFLMRNPRRVLSKRQILDQVWEYDFGGNAHVVELCISALRKKIDAGRERMIHTARGVGYVIKPASLSPERD